MNRFFTLLLAASCLTGVGQSEYCLFGTVWDGNLGGCVSANTADINNDGCVQISDLLDLLTSFNDCIELENMSPCEGMNTLVYHDVEYNLLEIGSRCWFMENLRTRLYQNGDSILNDVNLCPEPNQTYGCNNSGGEWPENCFGCGALSVPQAPLSWGIEVSTEDIYGLMYNNAAVEDPRKVCPTGWGVAKRFDYEYVCDWYGNEVGNLYKNGLVSNGTGGWDIGEVPECTTTFNPTLDLRPGGDGTSPFPSSYAIGRYATYWAHNVSSSSFEPGDRYMELFRIGGCTVCPGEWFASLPYTSGFVRCVKDAD